jgi:hypothetical protein
MPEIMEVHVFLRDLRVCQCSEPDLPEVVPLKPTTLRPDEHHTGRTVLGELLQVLPQLSENDLRIATVRTPAVLFGFLIFRWPPRSSACDF